MKNRRGPKPKITVVEANEIVEMYLSNKFLIKDIAKKFGVTHSTISDYLGGWRKPIEWE